MGRHCHGRTWNVCNYSTKQSNDRRGHGHRRPGTVGSENRQQGYKMRWLLIAVFFASCCPKITEEPPKITTTSDTVTVFRTDTVMIPARVDTFLTTIDALRDSLEARGAVTLTGEEGVRVEFRQDPQGQLRIIATCDSLQAVIDSIQETTITDTVRVETTKIVTKTKRKGKWWIWLLVGLTGGLVASIILRR